MAQMHPNFSAKKLIVLSVGLHAALLIAPIQQKITQSWQIAPAATSGISVVLQAAPKSVPVVTARPPQTTPRKVQAPQPQAKPLQQQALPTVVAAPAAQLAPIDLEESAFKRYIHPLYPRIAMIQGIEGSVRLELWANERGQVARAEIIESSGYPVLDEAALDAAKKWVFNQPISTQTKLSKRITFRIEN